MSKQAKRPKQPAERIPTTEKLARALAQAGAPETMIERARDGYYDDYKSPIATPIMALVQDCRRHNLADIEARAIKGDFDGQKWEAEEWAKSPEGRVTFNEFIKHFE